MGLLWRSPPAARAAGEGEGLWVCVGGVEWGGAGKTPVALWIAARAAGAREVMGEGVAFVSHGYRGASRAPERVPPLPLAGGLLGSAEGERALRRWGDEALMARALLPPEVSVWAGGAWGERSRAAGRGARVVVCDGGLYRAEVPRHLSLVVTGVGARGWPRGRARPAWALPRACAWWAHDGHALGVEGSPSPLLEGLIEGEEPLCALGAEALAGSASARGAVPRRESPSALPSALPSAFPARCGPLVGWSAYEPLCVLSPEGERLPVSVLRGVAVEPWVGVARPERFLWLLERLGARLSPPVRALNHGAFPRPTRPARGLRVCTLKDLPRLHRGGGFFALVVGLTRACQEGAGGAAREVTA